MFEVIGKVVKEDIKQVVGDKEQKFLDWLQVFKVPTFHMEQVNVRG